MVFLLVVITVVAVTLWMTPSFMSTVRMRVDKDTPDINLLGVMGSTSQQYDPYFLATEFEVLKSHKILSRVVEKLSLDQVYAERAKVPSITMQTAIKILSGRIDVKLSRNTSLIEISAYDQDPKFAADIANAVAETYKDEREKKRKERETAGLTTLTEELEKANEDVRDAQATVDELRTELKVADPILASTTAQSLSAQTMARMDMNRTDLKSALKGHQALLSAIQGHRGDQLKLRNFLSVARPTSELTSLLSSLNQAQQRKVTMASELGFEHPDMKRIESLLATINSQVDDQVEGIISALESQVRVTEAALEAVDKEYLDTVERTNLEYTRLAPYLRAKEDLDTNIRLRNAMQLQVAQEMVNSQISKSSSVEIFDRAIEGERPVKPSKTLNFALGAVFGLLLGIGLAFFIEYLDTSVKTIDDVEQALGAPVLGVIPQNVGALINEGVDSPHAEAYRVLRTNILFSRKSNDARTMTVVSGGAGEGKSTTIFNLATVFAQQGNRVLIVDSDLRRPSLHKILGVANSLGLTNYLLKQNSLEEVVQTTTLPNLDFLPSGKLPSSSLGILNSNQMKDFVRDAKARYDFVFFDSPPIMGVSDASVLASEVDMAVLVVQYRKYPLQMTLRAKQMVEKIGGPDRLLGVVLNNINISQDSYYYYYSGYYYDYYSRSADSKEGGEKSGRKSGSKGSGREGRKVSVAANGTGPDSEESPEVRNKF